MLDATLCFLVHEGSPQRVLMGQKKIGLGVGKITGFGGKVKACETIAAAAARELEEETGIRVARKDLRLVGHLTFRFPAQPDWSQNVHVFLATTWEGELAESKEMRPFWFAAHEVPYNRMWQDGAYWLPRILAGEKVRAVFTFSTDNETVESVQFLPWLPQT
jgi:8-oxo-dGTP diphosphatase